MTMIKKVRWGILGCASIAKNAMIPAIQQSSNGEVYAIASRSLQQAKQVATEHHIPVAYGSYEHVLTDPNVDAVYIPLPNHLHKEWTVKAASAGKHILCEKPIALNEAEACEMADLCARAGVLLSENFMYCEHPRYSMLKELIASGEIGQIRGIHATFTFNQSNAIENVRFKQAWGGGGIYDVGVYPIHVARFILETEPVAATMIALFSSEHDDVDMMAAGLLEFPNGIGLTFDCGMWASFRNELEILGTIGRIQLPLAFISRRNEQDHLFVTVQHEKREIVVPYVNHFTLKVETFGQAIVEGTPLLRSPLDSIANMRVVDACLRSARERTRVVIQP